MKTTILTLTALVSALALSAAIAGNKTVYRLQVYRLATSADFNTPEKCKNARGLIVGGITVCKTVTKNSGEAF